MTLRPLPPLPLCVYAIILILSSQTLLAQKKITLTFNEDGRLVSEPLSRFKFAHCKRKCRNLYDLRARVLMPVDYFKDEEMRIDSMAIETYSALKDTSSMLFRILSCGKNHELEKLQQIVNGSSDIANWNVSKENGTDTIVPAKLIQYVRFIRLLDSVRLAQNDSKTIKRLLTALNNFLEFSPFRFNIKGFQIETNCMQFAPVLPSDNYCKCILPGKAYIAIEFGIPRKLITENLSVDSFQVVQYFAMKKFAIERYNAMLSAQASDVKTLKTLEAYIKKYKLSVSDYLAALDEQEKIKEICVGEDRASKLSAAQEKTLKLKDSLDKNLGKYDCNNPCGTDNILFCSSVLPQWILKLVWLNGDLIRLNPFNFTNKTIEIAETPTPDAPPVKALSESDLALAMKDDSLKLTFWNTAIAHFQDSVLRNKAIDIDSAKAGITKLIAERDAAQKDLDVKTAGRKQTDQDKATNTNANSKNADDMSSFITVSKVRYKGWIVPYKAKSQIARDKVWLRNYYYNDRTGLAPEDKFRFTYPEDENLTVLVHNLSPGMAIKTSESISPATDSSEWTKFADGAIKQLSQLYASVQPVAGLVHKGLQVLNKSLTVPTIPPNVPATIIGTNVGFNNFEYKFSTEKDTLIKVADSLAKFAASANVTVSANNQSTRLVLPMDRDAIFNSLNEAIKSLTGTVSKLSTIVEFMNTDECYTKYIKSLLALQSAPDLIDQPLKARNDSTPSYFTFKYPLTDSIPTYVNKYSIRVAPSAMADSLNQVLTASSFIKVAPYHYFSLAAGLAYTPGGGSITSVDTTGGGLKIDRDEDKVRLVVGVRYYPFGLYNLPNPVSVFREFRWVHRLSILAATGIPKPLNNLYLGGGFDLFPGLTFSAGAHFQQQNEYEILNNQISNRSIHYRAHLFYSLTMDPTLVVSAVTAIFK